MKLIRDIHRAWVPGSRPVISFEFFPPKTEEGDKTLLGKTVPELLSARPDFCSVTYGAGGSTREKTLSIAERIQNEHHLTTMAHLTCVNATSDEIGSVLSEAEKRGIRNVLALRGDSPGGGEFVKTAGGFEFSAQLIQFIRRRGGFCIGTAGFPEGHIACKDGKEVDWQRLKEKIDCGADFVVTQLFYDNEDFYRFREHLVKKLGVTVPICAGILPVLSITQIKRFAALCGARIPADMENSLTTLAADEEGSINYGIEYATRQCGDLAKNGVCGFHFYTLNKTRSTLATVRNLGWM
ncbi:MAG: Methylenetetrahydrofolate reductase [Verrucomicrobiales bacterium]|nr:Methylenetetrahydrofolate reductase [Verrucomicrobiales bacterium]